MSEDTIVGPCVPAVSMRDDKICSLACGTSAADRVAPGAVNLLFAAKEGADGDSSRYKGAGVAAGDCNTVQPELC